MAEYFNKFTGEQEVSKYDDTSCSDCLFLGCYNDCDMYVNLNSRNNGMDIILKFGDAYGDYTRYDLKYLFSENASQIRAEVRKELVLRILTDPVPRKAAIKECNAHFYDSDHKGDHIGLVRNFKRALDGAEVRLRYIGDRPKKRKVLKKKYKKRSIVDRALSTEPVRGPLHVRPEAPGCEHMPETSESLYPEEYKYSDESDKYIDHLRCEFDPIKILDIIDEFFQSDEFNRMKYRNRFIEALKNQIKRIKSRQAEMNMFRV